jgi:aspartate/methionine/tyrosine aminotransferase
MKLRDFLLDEWLERYEGSTRYDLAASTGPRWTLEELRGFMTPEDEKRLFETPLTYRPGHGGETLRSEIASFYGARADEVQIVTGASEALLALFFLAAEPGANVVLPFPAFPPFLSIPESLGVEVRKYELDPDEDFRVDVGSVARLVDQHTKLLLVNSPHNPTGAVMEEDDIRALAELASKRGAQLVVDEVYHPIYRRGEGQTRRSAGEYCDATILGDFSKAFSLSGLRTGWILERDPARRQAYWNARAHFSISNNFPGELLAEIAVRHRETIFDRVRTVATRNLETLDRFFEEHEDRLAWVRPEGGMTAFPWLRSREPARALCEAAAQNGVLLAPGSAFDCPSHFRLGFAACSEGFDEACEALSHVVAAMA